MRLNFGKFSAFLILFGWLAICSPAVSAQDKTTGQQQTAFDDFHSEILQIEPEAKVNLLSEQVGINKATDAPKTFPKSDKRAKFIFENNDDAETTENESSTANKTGIDDFAYHYPLTGGRQRRFLFKDSPNIRKKKFLLLPTSAIAASLDEAKNGASLDNADNGKTESFHWRSAIGQSLMFLAIQHGYAFTQPKTREALKGKFWKDYVHSVKSLNRWDDGGRFFTNYIAHPMQGAFTGFIQIQNDPKGLKQQFGASGDYWRSRLKAMAWSAAWSTQFEIGPISQASIGNVGLKGKQTWGDIVVTPTVGTAMLISEDAIDRFVMKRIESATENFYVRIFSRMLLSPTRTIANLFRFKTPWYRDRPPEH